MKSLYLAVNTLSTPLSLFISFIDSHVAEWLLPNGWAASIVDSFKTSRRYFIKTRRGSTTLRLRVTSYSRSRGISQISAAISSMVCIPGSAYGFMAYVLCNYWFALFVTAIAASLPVPAVGVPCIFKNVAAKAL